MEILFVCLVGVVTVFACLICIIALVEVMHYVYSTVAPKRQASKDTSVSGAPVPNAPIENRAEVIAAISAVIAEDLGKDAKAIRIKSIKRI